MPAAPALVSAYRYCVMMGMRAQSISAMPSRDAPPNRTIATMATHARMMDAMLRPDA
jgi:hypothetical protein